MTISQWLDALGLAAHQDAFEENGVDLALLPELTNEDLKDLGVARLVDRKKLLKAIEALSEEPSDDNESSASEAAASPSAAEGPSDAGPLEAERRQLTVMFCDLVGSTQLSARLDPEDMRAIILGYQNAVAGEVTRFEGHVAKFMGDGVLAYFGWPQAHEDDAERAVRAALSIQSVLARQTLVSGQEQQVRIGIATGLVVVGDLVGQGSAQEEAVVGDTPNLAARLQGVAEPGQVVVSQATRALLGDIFVLQTNNPQPLKGIGEAVSSFTVGGEKQLESRFAAKAGGQMTPLVGRDHELALILDRWQLAQSGEGQMVLLSGEAGIGKSRIASAAVTAIIEDRHHRVSTQCSPYHTDSALYPVIQQFARAAGFQDDDGPTMKLEKLEALVKPLSQNFERDMSVFTALMGIDAAGRYPPLDLSPPQLRALTLQALIDHVLLLSRDRPVLFVLEDLHWIDPTSLELVTLTLDQIRDARVLLLVTSRPNFEHGFGGHPLVTRLALNRLARTQTVQIVDRLTGGKPLPSSVLDEIAAKTDGVPLFVEELTKTILEGEYLEEREDSYVLLGSMENLAIPSSLHDSLMARLDRLQPVKEVAQTAACIGREFSYRLLASVSPLSDEALASALDRLVDAELVFRRGIPPDAQYTFKHALVRDAAYESLLRATRQNLHGLLLESLVTFGGSAPEVLAQHAEAADQNERAVEYWEQAGQEALKRPAFDEAINHIHAALRLVANFEATPSWKERELDLLVRLTQALIPKDGHDGDLTTEAFARADALMAEVESSDHVDAVFYGRWVGAHVRGQHSSGLERARARLAKMDAEGDYDTLRRFVYLRYCATSAFCAGLLIESETLYHEALEYFDAKIMVGAAEKVGQDPFVSFCCYQINRLWLQGRREEAWNLEKQIRARVEELNHVNTAGYAAIHLLIFAMVIDDKRYLIETAEMSEDLAHRYDTALYSIFSDLGMGLCQLDRGDLAGEQRFQKGFQRYTEGNLRLFSGLVLSCLAQRLMKLGAVEAAQSAIEAAAKEAEDTEEHWFDAEAARVAGTLHLAKGDRADAEANYRKALEIALSQGAVEYETRARQSLAELEGEGSAFEA